MKSCSIFLVLWYRFIRERPCLILLSGYNHLQSFFDENIKPYTTYITERFVRVRGMPNGRARC